MTSERLGKRSRMNTFIKLSRSFDWMQENISFHFPSSLAHVTTSSRRSQFSIAKLTELDDDVLEMEMSKCQASSIWWWSERNDCFISQPSAWMEWRTSSTWKIENKTWIDTKTMKRKYESRCCDVFATNNSNWRWCVSVAAGLRVELICSTMVSSSVGEKKSTRSGALAVETFHFQLK